MHVRDYAITWLDTEGRIATWNAGAERTYGWSAAEAVERIADLCRPFVQVENVLTRRHHGSGMGLFITKALVERHGGTLQIDSHPNKGTTVRITLPTERLLPAEGLLAAAIVSPSLHQKG